MRTMLFLILPASAWAQDVMPDQPRHVRKMTEELIALSKAKTHEAKMDLFLKQGEERARELEEMQARGKSSHSEALAASYNGYIGKGATGAIENGAAKGRDMTGACGRYVEATSKHTAVLERVLANAPEAARKGLLNALEASQHGHQQAMLAHERGKGKAGKGGERRPPEREDVPGKGGPPPGKGKQPGEEGGPGAGKGKGPGAPEHPGKGGPDAHGPPPGKGKSGEDPHGPPPGKGKGPGGDEGPGPGKGKDKGGPPPGKNPPNEDPGKGKGEGKGEGGPPPGKGGKGK
jgi:hypothetical protein